MNSVTTEIVSKSRGGGDTNLVGKEKALRDALNAIGYGMSQV